MEQPMEHAPTSDSQRDAIVEWLEKDDNFLRVTASSAPAAPHGRRGLECDPVHAELVESNALNELAATVNAASPGAKWDGKHAKQMLKHYLLEFKSTARAAGQPGFMLSKTDESFGIKTIEDKLNSMCRHFARLQMLHDPRIRAAMRWRALLKERIQDKTSGGDLVSPQQKDAMDPSEVPAHQSHQNGVTSKTQETPKEPNGPHHQDKQADENSVEKGKTTMARNGQSPKEQNGGVVEKQKVGKKSPSTKNSSPQTPLKKGKKRAVSAKCKQQQQKKKRKEEQERLEKERAALMPNFIHLSSEEEEEDEELPFLQSKPAAVKAGKLLKRAGSESKSAHSDEDDSPWLKRKIRRVESTGSSARAEVQRTPPRATRSSSKTPPRTKKSTPPKGKNTPSKGKNAPSQGKSTSNKGKKSPPGNRKPVQKVVKAPKVARPAKVLSQEAVAVADGPNPQKSPVEKSPGSGQESVKSISPATKPAPSAGSDPPKIQEPVTQTTDVPPNVVEAIPPPQSKAQGSAVPQTAVSEVQDLPSLEPASKVPDLPTQVVKNTPAQPRVQVPDALRSAIAQVVSQRQELLNSRWGRRQIRQPSFSDSDYAPSGGDDEEDEEEYFEEDSDTASKANKRRNPPPPVKNSAPAHTRRTLKPKSPRPSHKVTQRGTERSPLRVQDSPVVNNSPGVPSLLSAGHIPALLNLPHTVGGDTNLERKRAFFQAKKLAFEQFKWIREGELQQLEVELLRREMETRESFAQKEIELKQMNIRVEVIQRMVLAGASVDDVSERLALLQ